MTHSASDAMTVEAVGPRLPRVMLEPASLRWPLFFICIWIDAIAVASFVFAAIVSGQSPDAHFDEGAAVTYFSAGQLVVLAGLSLMLYVARLWDLSPARRGSSVLVWLLISGGMIALACDEALQLHEQLDQALHHWLGLSESPWTDRLDDLIVLAYGVIGLGVLWACRVELLPFRRVWPYLAIAFAMFFIMVAIDLLTNSYGIDPSQVADAATVETLAAWGRVIEDACKLASEAAFMGAFMTMLFIARSETVGRSARSARSGRSHDQACLPVDGSGLSV